MTFSALPLGRLAAFLALGAADFALTAYLLRHGTTAAYEANPLARWVLVRHGWLGLAGFKAASMGVAVALALLVARHQPALGGRLATVCCLVVAGVVGYSTLLAARGARVPADEAAPLLAEARAMEDGLRRSEDYRVALEAAVEDLERGACALDAAADRLARTAKGQDPAWYDALRALYQPLEHPRPLLAASLVQHVSTRHRRRPDAAPVLDRLRQDFYSTYGQALPDFRVHALPPPAGRSL